ncbi:aminotransferase class I/II-fold pyridoxal phosphate-dependent enzyme [Listeria welshimeri]|uniref:methionine gamma-lyase family protein n=1 Tax=Listeria welshimeri TaxID=1643 RepID=UPI00162A7DD2|nr:aminotransferase class I/II-fold pyridoxal phosphate-dependent enzyme [Listeria welshimeri]MBC1251792.1 aminotransferase class I/II-fold pyridoxal phosphate-dependent enzyme [Listeria welshimeri]MBC2089472.1 aminotransferase class I/II-fold pyridoxal phosphate-dependent enzyme [Listeria welshimeri]MBC2334715.1 aminotransferase class I/II-fold pyridoxal phosphate-dependent enzyme [Listeria welshimeri]MBF2449728.1 aminotransferase class I/II-fold pyridoxal phosphate-dependent enzyme [Listeria 
MTEIQTIRKKVELQIASLQNETEEIAEFNQAKVLDAFQENKVSDFHFNPSTGYGYDDEGRDTLERVYADVFKTEAALVRPQIISGTHAISTVLFGILRPGDDLLYLTGQPYDTLEEIVGIRSQGQGSLKDFQIGYDAVPLKSNGEVDFIEAAKKITSKTKMVGIQRSRGYADRPSFTVEKIKEMIAFVKKINPNIIIFVDNCYGEFVERQEPPEIGADIIAGSLIKNPGGGLAKTGGYIAGKVELVDLCGYRLTTPGIGKEAGASLYSLLEMYQGFFLAPHVTSQAIKGARFTAAMLAEFNVEADPVWDAPRTDLIQSISFHNQEKMVTFAQAIQKASPVNAHVLPIGAYMPGYEDDVIMAAGTFIQGASLELTADGPIREPYQLYVQGGLTYEHVKIAVTRAIQNSLLKN